MPAVTQDATPTQQQIHRATSQVAHLRVILADVRDDLAKKRAAFEAENAGLIRLVAETDAELTAAEAALRAMALTQYAVDGNKHVGPGVQIKVRQTLDYDRIAALSWCDERGLCVMKKLDEKAFAKIVPTLSPEHRAELHVTTGEEPTVTLATDLTAAIAGGL